MVRLKRITEDEIERELFGGTEGQMEEHTVCSKAGHRLLETWSMSGTFTQRLFSLPGIEDPERSSSWRKEERWYQQRGQEKWY